MARQSDILFIVANASFWLFVGALAVLTVLTVLRGKSLARLAAALALVAGLVTALFFASGLPDPTAPEELRQILRSILKPSGVVG